eukprot:Gb_32693 [translate_table: standard]
MKKKSSHCIIEGSGEFCKMAPAGSSMEKVPVTQRKRPLAQSESHEDSRNGTVKEGILNLSCGPVLRPIVTSCSSEVESSNRAGDSNSSVTSSDEDTCNSDECRTPKAKECRIPEFLPCPPAPRKRRVVSRYRSVPSSGFFTSPDLDLLFFPRHKISVNI